MAGNYDKMQEDARRLFLTMDLDAGCRRVGLRPEAEGVRFRAFGQDCFLRRADAVVLDGSGEQAGFSMTMSVYDVLGRSGEPPRLRGEFVPTSELHGIMGSNSVHEDLGRNEGRIFDGKERELTEACRALGGIPGGKGDVSFTLPVFEFFPVQLRFWASDEEFPPLVQWFWDANALQFARYETLWYMAGEMRSALAARLG